MQNVVIYSKIDLQRDFATGVYLYEAQYPIPSPTYRLYSVYAYTEPEYLNF